MSLFVYLLGCGSGDGNTFACDALSCFMQNVHKTPINYRQTEFKFFSK